MSTRTTTVMHRESWVQWRVFWSAVWVGALSAIALLLIFGLTGIVLGAYAAGPGLRITDWGDFGLGALIFAVFGSFLAFVVGGWVCARIAGLRFAEAAALHGAIVWLLAVHCSWFWRRSAPGASSARGMADWAVRRSR